MFGLNFYHGSIRKYVSLFGTLFNDIRITRETSDNALYQTINVPIGYGPKEKVLARLKQDPNLDRKYAVQLPRMAFELTNVNYAPERKLLTINRNRAVETSDGTKQKYQYNPVPYDFMFSLYIYAKNAEDGARILEQILPFFTPEWTATVNLIPEMNIAMDIPVVLLDVVNQDVYEDNFETRRTLIWTLNFIVKGYVFGPIRTSGIINIANTNFFDATITDVMDNAPSTVTTPLENVVVEPGLTANGLPTSNAAISVPSSQILANDNYGYIITTTTP
jgi:hypothetical protein